MGCGAATTTINQSMQTANLEHQMVYLVVTNQTNDLIKLITHYQFQINLNAPLNFRGDTLLHYACAKSNMQLVQYLIDRADILMTVRNNLKQRPSDLTRNQQIKRLCS